MLIELEKNQLTQLLHRCSFTHLKLHPEVYSVKIPEQEIYVQNVSEERKRRKIFYSVPYESQEIAMIEEVKRMMEHASITENINDQLILKHIYAAKWDNKKALQRIKELIAYNNNPVVTRLNEQTIEKLQNGSIYTYGHDKNLLPLIIMRVDKIDFKAPLDEIFNIVYYLILVVKAFKMVPYHAQKYALIIDFNDISFTSIPYFQLYDIIQKMGTYYCGLTERTFLYNSAGISKIWKVVYNFLPEYQKKKIVFIHKGQEKKILGWVEETQLQRKYGGKLPNLNVFWPPRQSNQNLPYLTESDEYYSVQDNLEFFDPTIQSASTCDKNCSCSIY